MKAEKKSNDGNGPPPTVNADDAAASRGVVISSSDGSAIMAAPTTIKEVDFQMIVAAIIQSEGYEYKCYYLCGGNDANGVSLPRYVWPNPNNASSRNTMRVRKLSKPLITL